MRAFEIIGKKLSGDSLNNINVHFKVDKCINLYLADM